MGTIICEFTVPGQPVSKGRPRFGTIQGRARVFTDRKTENYEGLVCMAARPHAPAVPSDAPLSVDILAVFKRPKRLLERYAKTGELKHADEGAMLHPGKPDLDNIVKAVLDGMNRAGIWLDDSQVACICASKFYAAIGKTPGVHVKVSEGWL